MKNITVSEACRKWAESRKHWDESERRKVGRLIIQYVDPVAEGVRIAEMDDAFRRKMMGRMDRMRATEESREILIGMMRDVAEGAVRRKRIPYNPFLEIPPFHRKGKKYPALSEAEIRKLLHMDPRIAAHACMQVQLLTGMRPAEARGLCWEDISERKETIWVRHQLPNGKLQPVTGTKNGKVREIQPPRMTFDILREIRMNGGEDTSGLVFLEQDGSPMNGAKLNRMLKEITGRDSVRLHDLRVTHATLLFRATGDLRKVSRRLGHSDLDVTQRHYVDVRPDLSKAQRIQNRRYGRMPGAGAAGEENAGRKRE